ncbi:ATP-binding protein [Nocardioides panaciterrulae]|uniref:PAS domain S-box-containing protein n=1 Tax=Nocardioides panaciterrulae TaxID=661492 RepID=A0A7Y9E3X1_9ACTN|nr:PAS domain S-box protein [Nocardioides panaciterrulae]NYD40441.1 PAS domain S-box-containing protein [Nocardioides panaciterrulae]
MEGCARGVHRGFDARPSSAAGARRLVREELARAGREDLRDAAELLVTELVTNALVHSGTPMEVCASVGVDGLYVEVHDASPQLPLVRHHADLAGTGRGLRLLQHMADRWGAEPRSGGKCVWFELTSGEHADEWLAATLTGVEQLALREDPPDAVLIELLNVPLLLHQAWAQHAEALLREHLLTTIGEDDGPAALQAHAAASKALGLLLEQLPDPSLAEDPDQLMSSAVEPVVSRPRLVVAVPRGSLRGFRMLDELLDAALALAEAGVLLNPPTQPEIRTFRRWICHEVLRQGEGGRPTPWTDQSDAAPPATDPLPSEVLEEIAGATAALVAADDADGIVALSPTALALLGYDTAAELVGRRLLAMIPSRYRQAHLAGFTMHLANGRAPLLGHPVRVPALRRDGSEVIVELLVEARRLPGGRRLFVAELRP